MRMKRVALVLAMVAIPMLAQAGNFEITVERKKEGVGAPKGAVEQKISQKWTGEVKIVNRAFKPAPPLEAKYIVFVKRQQLGQKQNSDHIEKIKGAAKVSALKAGENTKILTSDVELHHQRLAAGWSYANGGSAIADDTVVGVWLRLFDGTTQVAEYMNPTSLMAKYKWEQ